MHKEKIVGAKPTWSPYDLLPLGSKNVLKRFWIWLGFGKDFGTACRYELDMLLLRVSCAISIRYQMQVRQLRRQKGLRVNLGCGWVPSPGWINLDCYPPPKQESSHCEVLVLDMRQKLPFADASVDAIYSEHFMEHLPFDIVCNHLLPECFRILSPGGSIRMGVPDGELFVQRYQSGSAIAISSKTTDSKTLMMDINDIGHSGGHFYLYDYEVLEKIFNEVGFRALQKCKSLHTHAHCFDQMDQEDEWRINNTVFIEGQK